MTSLQAAALILGVVLGVIATLALFAAVGVSAIRRHWEEHELRQALSRCEDETSERYIGLGRAHYRPRTTARRRGH